MDNPVRPMQMEEKLTPLRRALPGLGYTLSLAICAAAERWFVAQWGRTGRELTWFVLAPALFSLTHLVLTRQVPSTALRVNSVEGPALSVPHGRGFGLLGGLWGAAAAVGLLSHWRCLDAIGPWLSLIRYALIALAGCLFCISVVLQRPLFAIRDPQGPLTVRIALGALGGAMLLAWLGLIALVVCFTPFPVALAPPEQGLRHRRVWTSDLGNYFVWLVWSPDGQALVGQGRGIWLVEPGTGAGAVVSPDGVISPDNPWRAPGLVLRSEVASPLRRVADGFYLVRGSGDDTSLCFASTRTNTVRRLRAGGIGVPSCSPDGKAVAFDSDQGLVVARSDGSWPQVVAEAGEVPRWSPDGRRLLVTRAGPDSRRYWIVTLDRKSWSLETPVVGLGQVAWVSGEMFATVAVSDGPAIPFLGVRRTARVILWDLQGKRVRDYPIGSYLGDARCWLAASREGRRLAIAADMWLPFADPLVMLDLTTGRLSRLPAPSYTPGSLAWSPDGRSLALSDAVEEDHGQGCSYVAVISGFRLLRKEKA
jgi:Tol biopolymer transport system component